MTSGHRMRMSGLVVALAFGAVACSTAAVPSSSKTTRAHAPPGLGDATRSPRPTPTVVAHPRTSSDDFRAGMAVLAYSGDAPDVLAQKSGVLLDRLASRGLNSVSLVFPLFQDGWRATQVRRDPQRTPSDAAVEAFAREAERRRFSVMLRPILDEASLVPDGKWRGSIQPADRDAWFDSYGELLLGYARLAETAGVDSISVGSEFTSLQAEASRWSDLITEVRAVYGGELTYSANWDAVEIPFAGELDFLSIDAFFPLDAPDDASAADLAAAWRPWLDRLRTDGVDLSTTVFTEVGTTAEAGSYRKPYVWDREGPADQQTQRRFYQAVCEVVVPKVGGVHWWAANINHPEGSPDADGFDPLGKAAEDEIGCLSRRTPR